MCVQSGRVVTVTKTCGTDLWSHHFLCEQKGTCGEMRREAGLPVSADPGMLLLVDEDALLSVFSVMLFLQHPAG